MEQTETAKKKLEYIEEFFFKRVNLAKASLLEGDKRRTFRLVQTERLLKTMYGCCALAVDLSDQFWTFDEGRKPIRKDNPLLLPEDKQGLTKEEVERLKLIKEIAGLCHDLSQHFTFDPKESFGISKDDFRVTNKQLVEWLNTTKYEHIAVHTAYTMKRNAINEYIDMDYQTAQDTLAMLYSKEYRKVLEKPEHTKIPPRAYVKTILDKLLLIERHWQRGRRLKLNPELVKLHDEIYGVVPRHFDRGVLAAAQELFDYMDKELQGRLLLKDFDENAWRWYEQPEPVKRIWSEIIERFADKVREVRSKYLPEGWLDDDSTAFSYLIAHAENCGRGIWREEEKAL